MMFYFLIFSIFSVVKVKQDCSNNCQECMADNPENCTLCLDGYGFTYNEESLLFQCTGCSDENCESCNDNFSICTGCKNNYGLVIEDGKNTGKCQKCPEYCKSCSKLNYKECSEWDENTGPILDENNRDTGEHAICPGDCNCSENAAQCKCTSGYGKVLDQNNNPTGQCAKCPDNCISCDENSEFCDECEDEYGFVLNKNKENTGQCQKCIGNCKKCSDDYTFCTECPYYFGLVLDKNNENTGKCSNCLIAHCYACQTDYTICEFCSVPYTLVTDYEKGTSKCVRCPEGCTYCMDDPNICQSCDTTFGPEYDKNGKETGKCVPCPENCYSCNESPDKCERCTEGYGLIIDSNGESTGKCERCRDPRCNYCSENSNEICNYRMIEKDEDKETVTIVENRKTVKNTIKSTINNCKDSSYDPNLCSVCDDGYGFVIVDGKRTGECKKCGENCLYCRTNADLCTLCKDGFGFVIDSSGKPTAECKPCQENCLSCSSDYQTCKLCKDGYGLELDDKDIPTGACKPCPDNCELCYYDNKVCTKCLPTFGHVKNDPNKLGQCQRCIPSLCLDCNDDYTYCSECIHGPGTVYDIDNDGKLTGKCSACPNNCKSCTTSETCYNCLDNYGFERNSNGMMTGKCGRCPAFCKDCYYDSSKCSICIDGYGKDKDGKCQPCPTNCKRCDFDLKVCNDCMDGYIFEVKDGETKNNCVSCGSNCQKCNSMTECNECKEGYRLSNNECIKCSANCRSCDENECYNCDYYYQLIDGKCTKCPEECANCNPDNTCYDCREGYGPVIINNTITETICKPCPQNCAICKFGSDYCNFCMDGYHFDSNFECIPTGETAPCNVEGCSICVPGTSDKCQTCSSSYKLDPNTQKCIKEYTPVVSPTPKPVEYILGDEEYSQMVGGNLPIDTSSKDVKNDEQLIIKFELKDDLTSITLINKDKNALIEIPSKATELTFKLDPSSDKNFDIKLPSNSGITIKLDPTSKSSIKNGQGTLTLDKPDDSDTNEININSIQPSSEDFELIPNVDIKVDELDLFGSNSLKVKSVGDSNKKVEIKKVKVQQNSHVKIENVALTDKVVIGLGSSLEINENVNLENSNLDFPYDLAQNSDGEAPLNGVISGKPKSILISSRKEDAYLEDARIILAKSTKDFGCNEWGKMIKSQVSGKEFKYECLENPFRLYAIEDSASGSEGDDKLSPGIIAAIVIAVVVVVGVVVFLLVFFLVIKKRKNNQSNDEGSEEQDDNADAV